MAGILDDVGNSIMNAATTAVTGMGDEERNELTAKMMSGTMDFNDFLKMTLLMQNEGGVGGVMSSVGRVPGLKKTLGLEETDEGEVEGKMKMYSKLIGAMTEEEREQPNYFLLGAGASSRVASLTEKAELPKDVVDEFFDQFSKMRTLFTKLGVKTREGKSGEQLTKEMDKELTEEEEASSAQKAPASTSKQFINPERQKKKALKRAEAKKKLRKPERPKRSRIDRR